MRKLTGYKGFDENLKCRGLQYEIGKTVTHKGKMSLCISGLHFCENPLDVWTYYGPTNRFTQVEAEGVLDQTQSDSKRVAIILHIGEELTLPNFIGAGVKFILDKVDFKNAPATNTGNSSAATNTGDNSAATNTGYGSAATNTGNNSAATNTGYGSAATNTGNSSAATNTGYGSAATNTGKEGCAISIGIQGRASAALGCWLTLAEWKVGSEGWHRIDVKTMQVDGQEIKAETFYQLKGGRFVEFEGGAI